MWPHKRGQGILYKGPRPQPAPTAAQASGSETDSAPPPEQQESPESPREDSQKTLAEERDLIEQKTRELMKEKQHLDKENERLDRENEELDKWIEKRERMNKWLEDVTEALNQGAPIPDQPQDPDIIYPGYREDKDTSEDAPGTAEKAPTPRAIEPPASGSPDNYTSGPTPQVEKEGPQENQDRIPLDEAISLLCNGQEDEKPPVPIEANVIVVNRAPAAPTSPTPEQDSINVEDNGQE